MPQAVRCRVLVESYRIFQTNQQYPTHLAVGKEIDVTLPLGEGDMGDWELWLQPLNPNERPGGPIAKKRRAVPVPGSEATEEPADEESLDDKRAKLVVEAAASLDEDSDEGWNAQGFATVKYVKAYVTKKTGERNPRWVTSALIEKLSE